MNGCTLEIAGPTITRSEGGALEAEYTMFDASEIELRATEYGAIREVGYRTTVADALARLDAAGATSAAIRDVSSAVQNVARHYAPAKALPLVGILTPAELLTAETFDAERRLYGSPVIDLGRIAVDSGVTGAAAALQAAGLAAWLREAQPDDEVHLRTHEYMSTRRPGERSIRRVSLAGLRALPAALARLRDHPPKLEPANVTTDVLLEWFKRRGASAERLAWAELALSAGRPSMSGPLADPRALAIDVLFDSGRAREAGGLVDKLEMETGRTPSIQYLRLRGALGSEPPQGIAERATALLAREPSAELRLLAARAWSDAGHSSRAIGLANEVVSDPEASTELKDQARKYLDVSAELVVEAVETRRTAQTAPAPPSMRPSAPDLVLDIPRAAPVFAEATDYSVPLSKRPTPMPAAPSAMPRVSSATPKAFIMGLSGPPLASPGRPVSAAPPTPAPPHASPHASPTQRPPPRDVPASAMTPEISFRPPAPAGTPSTWVRGASQPPFQSMPPGSAIPLAPAVPRFEPRPAELAETLSLPPGLHGQAVPFDAVPKSVAEARVQFTLLSRALGRSYREHRGVVLKTDLSGIEQMQLVLRERFSAPAIRNAEEASEVRSHGAFLSEVLARTFGAEWVDIAPSELGYWAMATPGNLRLFPFGRILRFILQGHRERDLVSYFLELDSRSRAPR